ncbi:von Willebrand factor type A [Thiomicrospira aerophila AL3]|uniref:von Willebrand factor type A n=1 Tax=Thiomicrospira aerophila AL3 TaxID=717772 RepID=W0DXZ6_9GAMM|nr:VWA domain-containing protein [Thiomicrospira aerophila]AHF02148.1 von Willebrand factor type A [Thiomicrospira aerophila AL3]
MFSEFMFIRPWWLLALIPSLVLWVLYLRRVSQNSDWQTIIEPKFQPWLLGNQNQTKKSIPMGLTGLLIIWITGIIALAGPSWQSQTLPAQPNSTGSIIVLDLSASMYADDLNPNRITRAQFKLTDLIRQNPELQLGLLAYAGTPHMITPLSQDATTLLNLLPHLTPSIMPRPGADAVAALNMAVEMLNQNHINQRHIIWLTDDVESHEIEAIVRLINQRNIQLSIMSVGTQQGGVIHHPRLGLLKDAQDQLIIAPVPETRLAQIAQQTGGRYVRLRLDDQDLSSLLPRATPTGRTAKAESTQQVNHPVDFGMYFVIALLLLAMFAIRRGWLMNLAGLALLSSLLSVSLPQPAWAEEQIDPPKPTWLQRIAPLFMTGDQRGYQAWLQQDYLAAEREFNDPNWHAASLYRIGGYRRAAELFAQDTSAQGQYNLANSLALAGQLEEALDAYDRALALQADFAQAQQNRDLVQQLLEQQAEAQPQANVPIPSQNDNEGEDEGGGGQASSDDSDSNQDDSQTGEETNQEGESANESTSGQNEQTSETRGETSGRPEAAEELDPGLIREEDPANNESAEEDAVEPTENEEGIVPGNQAFDPEQLRQMRERDQSNQAWLNQIQDNPGRFLQRKFQYQIQQESQTSRSRTTDQGGKTW